MWNSDHSLKDDLQVSAFIGERNQQSLDYFYTKYSPALYGIIYRITNDREIAEECLLETFLKAWGKKGFFQAAGTSFFTWLLHLARQAAFEGLARQKENTTMFHTFYTGYGNHYSAFELIYFKGLNFMQVAELSGLSPGELKHHLRMDLKIRNRKTKKS